jgi:hypothetical protein
MWSFVCIKLFLVNIRVGGRGIWHLRGRRKVHTTFGWGKHDGKRILRRPRCRWKGNIKMSFQDTEYGIYNSGSGQE